MKLSPDYGHDFVRDRALWLFVALLVLYAGLLTISIFYMDAVLQQMQLDQDFVNDTARNPEMMPILHVVMLVTYVAMAAFYVIWAWVATKPGKFAWWFTMVLQVMGVGLFLFAIISSAFSLVMIKVVPGMTSKMKTYGTGYTFETSMWMNLGYMAFCLIISLIVTYWWWQRRRMHGIQLGRSGL